jgi:hypothetical protein
MSLRVFVWEAFDGFAYYFDCESPHLESSILAERPLLQMRCIAESFRRPREYERDRHEDPLSQGLGFLQNSASKQPMEALFGYHIYWPIEQTLQFLNQSGRKPGTCRVTGFYKEVDVAG